AFNQHLLSRQRVTVDSTLFVLLADSLRSLIAAAAAGGSRDGTPLPPDAPDRLRLALRLRLAEPLARLADGPLSLADALEDLRFYPILFHALGRRSFMLELNSRLRTVVEGEIDSREALRRGLDRRPEVVHEVGAWIDAWRARAAMLRIAAAGAGAPAAGRETASAGDRLA